MHSKAKPPTKAEQERFRAITEAGCVPCWLDGREFEPCTIQHVVKGRKRVGHHATYGACPHHHFGHSLSGLTSKESERVAGPSLARSPKAYHARYGSEDELVELQNKLIQPILENT